jgi:hypothetical protein
MGMKGVFLLRAVLRFTVVDNSDFSPHRLTVYLDSPYPSLIRKLSILPISSSEDRSGLSDVLVPARVLPHTWPGAPLAPFLASSSAFPLKMNCHPGFLKLTDHIHRETIKV